MATFNNNGFTKDSYATILQTLRDKLQLANVTTDSSSPNENLFNINASLTSDIQEYIEKIIQNLDPETAEGIFLDRLVGINLIQRQAGQFTSVPVQITTDRALTLQGLNANINSVTGTGYTISDNTGIQYILSNTQNINVAGTYTLTFRAKNLGSFAPQPNTITNPVTVVLGVTGINNPTGATTVGAPEETDAQLKIRRRLSYTIAAQSYTETIQSSLLNISGVTDARVYENKSDITDSRGIPSHSIWCIISGGDDQSIATTINNKISGGCGLKGSVIYTLTDSIGSPILIKFDRPTIKNLYIKCDIRKTTSNIINIDPIKTYLQTNLNYKIGQSAETASITQALIDGINANGGGGYPVNVLISSDNNTWVEYLDVILLSDKWSVTAPNINITLIL